MKLFRYLTLSAASSAMLFLVPSLSMGQTTLVNQGVAGMTGAQTTTVSSTSTSPYTYSSSYMNDPVGTGGAKANLGITATATAGVSPVVYSGVTYTAMTGSVYNAPGFWMDTGAFADTSATATAANAGVSFTVASAAMNTAAATYYVGVDLVKVGDVAANITTGTVGTATVDFFMGVSLSAAPGASATTKVFVVGADTTSGKNIGPATTAFSGTVQYLGATGTTPITYTNLTATNGSNYANLKTGTTNYLSFGALFTEINSALSTIYGGSAPQWNQGDAVRFVPFTVDGAPAAAAPTSANSDFMGGTVNAGVTIPFGTNATSAITDAYATDVTFTLIKQSTDGFTLGVVTPVPEPSTWLSTSAMLLGTLGLGRWVKRRKFRS